MKRTHLQNQASLASHTFRPITKYVTYIHIKYLVIYTKYVAIGTAKHIYCFHMKEYVCFCVCEYMHSIIITITKMSLEKKVFENWAKIDFKKLYIAGISLLPLGLPPPPVETAGSIFSILLI